MFFEPTIRNASCKQHGVGLIETMIAVLVMAVGLMAAAQLQVKAMRFSHSAYYQTQAHFLAKDIMDRMRSNTQGVLDGEYDGATTNPSATRPTCSECSPAEVARQDLYDWSAQLHPIEGSNGFIPALQSGETPASGKIIRLANLRYAIEMQWAEPVQGVNVNQSLRLHFEMGVSGT